MFPRPRLSRTTRDTGTPIALIPIALILIVLQGEATLRAEPYRPSDDSEILERLPDVDARVGQDLQAQQTALRADTGNLELALTVARGYMRIGRTTADPRYFGYAEAALSPWLRQTDPPLEILVLRAVLRQSVHDFEAALLDLDAALSIDPGHVQARLSKAVIQRVRGDFREAAQTCDALSARTPILVRIACRSAALGLAGEAEASYRTLARTLANTPSDDPAVEVWVHTILGEAAQRIGWTDVAEKHYRTGLGLEADNSYLLGALADLLLEQGRYADARRLLEDARRTDGLLLRLALAETALGEPAAADYRRELESRLAASRRRGDERHLREEARFALQLQERPDEALSLSLQNWRDQREPGDAQLVLEAAIAAGKPGAADAVVDWLEATGLESRQIEALITRLKETPG